MGVYDTLIDGERQAQVKCFWNEMNIIKVGDEVPLNGTYIIVLPEREDARFALVKGGIFVGLSDCPPYFIDKWGGQLTDIDDFKDTYEELVQSISKDSKMEAEG